VAQLRPLSRGRRLGLRHQKVRAESPAVPAGRGAESWARLPLVLRPPEVLRLSGVGRQAALFRPPAVCRQAASWWQQGGRPEVSYLLRRGGCPDGRKASSAVCLLAVWSSQAWWARPSPEPLLAVWESSRVYHPALPVRLALPLQAGVFLRPVASPCVPRSEPWSRRRQAESSWWRPAVAWLLRPVGPSALGARELAESDAREPQPRAEPAVSVRRPAVARPERPVAPAELRRGAAWDAAEARQPAAVLSVAAAVPQRVAVSGAARQPVAASTVWRPAVDPSVAPWAFHRDRVLPWPVRRRAVRSARAMRMSQAASPSKRSWQAARCEGLSCDLGPWKGSGGKGIVGTDMFGGSING
jgi:hypothetical protein